MQLRHPRSVKYAFYFLAPVVVGIYHRYGQKRFSYFGTDEIVGDTLCILASAYFLWHAFRGRPAEAHDSFAAGVFLAILAIVLTLGGLGYERHGLKIAIEASLYVAAGFLFWCAHKGYPLGAPRKHT